MLSKMFGALLGALMYVFSFGAGSAGAAVTLTPGAVTATSLEDVRYWEPVTDAVNDNAGYTGASRIHLQDGASMFVGSQSWKLYYPNIVFGDVHGIFPVHPRFEGFGLVLEGTGWPVVNFRYLWGPGGSMQSFDSVIFTIANSDQWVGRINLPSAIGDPFGFEVETFCQSIPCSSRVIPYFAYSAPVPEPRVWALFLAGGALLYGALRRRSCALARTRL